MQFLDDMLRDAAKVWIEEVSVAEGSPLVGVLAVRDPGGGYLYNPSPDHQIRAARTLVVLGPLERVAEPCRRASG